MNDDNCNFCGNVKLNSAIDVCDKKKILCICNRCDRATFTMYEGENAENIILKGIKAWKKVWL